MLQMLKRLPLSIKLPPSSISDEYMLQFSSALMTFKHQVVFDTKLRKRRPLTDRTDVCCSGSSHPDDMSFAGKYPFPVEACEYVESSPSLSPV